LSSPEFNPLINIGVCTSEVKATEGLSRQDDVWCLNLSSGDVLQQKKWKQYYDCDEEDDEPTSA
jgi:hypothetical protein